jgi:hypothetical protein
MREKKSFLSLIEFANNKEKNDTLPNGGHLGFGGLFQLRAFCVSIALGELDTLTNTHTHTLFHFC